MVNIAKHIEYWRQSSQEDMAVARELIDSGRTRHGLFFAHLALEKMLKAHVCSHSNDLAPRIHRLDRLVEVAGVNLQPDHNRILVRMNEFNIEGRYPDSLGSPPTTTEAHSYFAEACEVFEWLTKQL